MSGGVAQMLGKWGERLVCDYLRDRKWRIREVNYRCRLGELDIVAEKGTYIAFVEVKLRKGDRFGLPREAVTHEKQRKLRATAEFYLQEHPSLRQPRFDVAEVYAPNGANKADAKITYIENAF